MYLHEASHGGLHRHKLEILSEQQNHRCCYCGTRFSDILQSPASASIEHVIRLCDSGTRTWENEVAACRWCNSSRGDIPADVFYQQVEWVRLRQVERRRKGGRRHGRQNRFRLKTWRMSAVRLAGPDSVMVIQDSARATLAEACPQLAALSTDGYLTA